MSRVAILVDLGFFLPRYRRLIECHAIPAHSAKQVAAALFATAVRHVHREHGEELYRIFVYDCKPLDKKAHHPVTGKTIDFSRTTLFKFRNDLHRELICLRKVALRLGELADDSRWVIRPEPLKRLLRKEITVNDLTEDDLRYDVTQKGVAIKFGLDIASLAYKKLVERIVLITGDSDFVPAAKLARREGLDVVLDPLWNHIAHSLHEHIDGLKSFWVKRDGDSRHELSRRVRSRRSGVKEQPWLTRRDGTRPWQRTMSPGQSK
ncbi:MAG TPA: NYN domain-containing protein [Steroidobacter sp.]|uniref:NYN domain-containing protein n=1 Tax=Steroidobacter sp. TaxID=1978227 RepID=UPI002ED8AE5F